MSWFDTANITSFAKSALKEAQKTIDKALDISESVTSSVNESIGALKTEIEEDNRICSQNNVDSVENQCDGKDVPDSNPIPDVIDSDQPNPSTLSFTCELNEEEKNCDLLEKNDDEKSPVSSENGIEVLKSDSGDDDIEISVTSLSSDLEIISSSINDNNNCNLKNNRKLNDIFLNAFRTSERFLSSLPNAKHRSSKSHSRELSNSSASFLDDNNLPIDFDKILKRVIDLNDVLILKENQYQELSNKFLAFEQQQGTKQISNEASSSNSNNGHVKKISILEKEVENSKKEQAGLRKQLAESNQLVKELRYEGEQLSQDVLKLNNVIKSLRSKAKSDSASMESFQGQMEELRKETEELKATLKLKNENELEEQEKTKNLKSHMKKVDKENSQLKNNLEDTRAKLETTNTSLKAAKNEISLLQKFKIELEEKNNLLNLVQSKENKFMNENDELKKSIQSLETKLKRNQDQFETYQKSAEEQKTQFLRTIEEINLKNESLTSQLGSVTEPLFKEIFSLKTSSNEKNKLFESTKKNFQNQLNEANEKLLLYSNKESAVIDKYEAVLKEKNVLLKEIEDLKLQHEKFLSQSKNATIDYEKKIEEFVSKLDEVNANVEKLKDENVHLTNKNKQLTEDLEKIRSAETKSSLQNSSLVQPEPKSIYESLRNANPRSSNNSLIAMLKHKDNEIMQLKLESNQNERERIELKSEIANLFQRLDKVQDENESLHSMKDQLAELNDKYDAICVMYGEKAEEVDELKLDLQDVNVMYKAQINDLIEKLNAKSN